MIDIHNVKFGLVRSCGCAKGTHRMCRRGDECSRFYKIYTGLKARCNNPNRKYSYVYCLKGIKCEWETFEEFKIDMYELYLHHIQEFGEKETTIDRINSNGNYNKENCRWATNMEQARNRKNNIKIEFNGEIKILKDWCKYLGISYDTVRRKIKKGINPLAALHLIPN